MSQVRFGGQLKVLPDVTIWHQNFKDALIIIADSSAFSLRNDRSGNHVTFKEGSNVGLVREDVLGSDLDQGRSMLSGLSRGTGVDLAGVFILHDNKRASLQAASFSILYSRYGLFALIKQRLSYSLVMSVVLPARQNEFEDEHEACRDCANFLDQKEYRLVLP